VRPAASTLQDLRFDQGEVWVISAAFGASNGIRKRSQGAQPVLDVFSGFDVPFSSLIEGKTESRMLIRTEQPKTRFLSKYL
jgi:hypothetical protein